MAFDRDIYDPDTVNLMDRVLKAATAGLPLLRNVGEDEARRTAMANKIMAAVAKGERDFEALKRAALQK
jgi:hypothetical protein